MKYKDFKTLARLGKFTSPFSMAYDGDENVNRLSDLTMQARIKAAGHNGEEDLSKEDEDVFRQMINDYRDALQKHEAELQKDGADKHKLELSLLDYTLFELNQLEKGQCTLGTDQQTPASRLVEQISEAIVNPDSKEELQEMENLQNSEGIPLFQFADTAIKWEKAEADIRSLESVPEKEAELKAARKRLSQAKFKTEVDSLAMHQRLGLPAQKQNLPKMFDDRGIYKEDSDLRKTFGQIREDLRRYKAQQNAQATATAAPQNAQTTAAPQNEPAEKPYEPVFQRSSKSAKETEILNQIDAITEKQKTIGQIADGAEKHRQMATMALATMPEGTGLYRQDLKVRQQRVEKQFDQMVKNGQKYIQSGKENPELNELLYCMKVVFRKNSDVNMNDPESARKAYSNLQKAAEKFEKKNSGFNPFRSREDKNLLDIAADMKSLAQAGKASITMLSEQDRQAMNDYDNYREALRSFNTLKIKPDSAGQKPATIGEITRGYKKLADAGRKMSKYVINDKNLRSMMDTFNDQQYQAFSQQTKGLDPQKSFSGATEAYDPQVQNLRKEYQKVFEQESRNYDAKMQEQENIREGLKNCKTEKEKEDYILAGWTKLANGELTKNQEAGYDRALADYLNPLDGNQKQDRALAESRIKGLEKIREDHARNSIRLSDDLFDEKGGVRKNVKPGETMTQDSAKMKVLPTIREKLGPAIAKSEETYRKQAAEEAKQRAANRQQNSTRRYSRTEMKPSKADSFTI